MAANEVQVAYALRLRSKRLRAQLQKIADADRRSLNEVINMACEEFVRERLAPVHPSAETVIEG